MLADAGFDGDGVEATDLIPPIRRHGKLVEPTRKARADLVSAARLDGLFGQRWKTENGELGDQTQVRRHHPLSQDPLARPGADYQGPGL
jgi:hypothetical protein